MKLRDRFLAGIESLFGVTFLHTTSNPYGDAYRRGIESLFGSTDLSQPYSQHPVIHQAISTVAADSASIEWQAFPAQGSEKKQATPLDDHEIVEFLEHRVMGFTFRQLREATAIYYMLDGEVYWYYPDAIIHPVDTPDAARLTGGGLILIPTSEISWEKPKSKSVPNPVFKNSREPIDIEKLTRFSRFNPYGSRGLSVVQPFYTDARADMGASKWNEYMLADRNGLPNIVLMPPNIGGGTPGQRKEVKEKWESSFSKGRAGVAVTPPGWGLQELGGSRRDMEFQSLRSGARETVLAGVGLVPFLAGVLDKANYANAREQKQVYWRGTIARMLSTFEDIINNDFLPKIGVTDIELYPQWELVRAMADDVEQKSRIAQQWFQLGLSKKVINETLEMGWDPDDIQDYEQGYLAGNILPSELAGETQTAPVAPVPPGDPGLRLAPKPGEPMPKAAGFTTEQSRERRTTMWRLSVIRLRTLERPVESIMRSWFKDIETKVVSRLQSISGFALRNKHNVSGIEEVLFDPVQATRELLDRITPRIKAALIMGGETVIVDAGKSIKFNPDDLRLAAKLTEQQMKVTGITETVRDQLRVTLQEAIDHGESAVDMANRVQDVMDIARGRAMTIARTEMGTAYSNGRMIGMKQAGINEHEWLSAKDDAVRPTHQIDGEKVQVGEPFSNDLLYPLDPAGPAEEVINCRCTTLPVVSEE